MYPNIKIEALREILDSGYDLYTIDDIHLFAKALDTILGELYRLREVAKFKAVERRPPNISVDMEAD